MSHPPTPPGVPGTAREECEAAFRMLVVCEGAAAGRHLRMLTSARRGDYLRHKMRFGLALIERDDAVTRLADAIRWLRDAGGPDRSDLYADRLADLGAEARGRATAFAGRVGEN